MRFEWDERDERIVANINKEIEEGGELDGLIFDKPGGLYSLSFVVKDPAKANMFIKNMLFSGREGAEHIEDKTGIQITQLNFTDNIVVDAVEERLAELLEFVRRTRNGGGY